MTASMFFAHSEGNAPCFLCGAPANVPRDTCIRAGFTNWDEAAFPNSEFVCAGCAESMNETADCTLIDGEVRDSQRRRLYSWLLAEGVQFAATKKHLLQIRAFILDPPSGHFGVVLSNSGQKHLVWRTPTNQAGSNLIRVRLEDDVISINKATFEDRLSLASQAVAACGKPGLYENTTGSLCLRFIEYYGNESLADRWFAVAEDAQTRLAWWLTPGMEVCREWHPSPIERRVPANNSWATNNRKSDKSSGDGDVQEPRNQLELLLG